MLNFHSEMILLCIINSHKTHSRSLKHKTHHSTIMCVWFVFVFVCPCVWQWKRERVCAIWVWWPIRIHGSPSLRTPLNKMRKRLLPRPNTARERETRSWNIIAILFLHVYIVGFWFYLLRNETKQTRNQITSWKLLH